MKSLKFLAASVLLGGVALGASLTELQTINADVNGSQGWVASFGTYSGQVSTNGYLSVGGIGGAGQYFVVNSRSRYQIVTCRALKSSSWAGFGVTYYDSSFNEIGTQRKEVTADIRNGDGERRQAIGLVPPTNAAYGYMWVWNNDSSGYVQLDDFRVVNYFPDGNANFDASQPSGDQYTQTFPTLRNQLVNGDFETTEFEADEFWNVVEANNSVFLERLQIGILGVTGLRMGSANEANFIYQTVPSVVSGGAYTFEVYSGRFGDDNTPAFSGVDFFDVNGNKIGDVVIPLDQQFITGRFAAPVRQFRNVTVPNGTVTAIAWAWIAPMGGSDTPVWVSRMSFKTREFEAPEIELVSAPDVTTQQFGNTLSFRITDNVPFNVEVDSLDGNDFVAVGPNGERTVSYRPRNPNVGGGDPDVYQWSVSGEFTAADNGTYTIFYNNGEIEDESGNATVLSSTNLGTFQVNIGVGVE